MPKNNNFKKISWYVILLLPTITLRYKCNLLLCLLPMCLYYGLTDLFSKQAFYNFIISLVFVGFSSLTFSFFLSFFIDNTTVNVKHTKGSFNKTFHLDCICSYWTRKQINIKTQQECCDFVQTLFFVLRYYK